MNLKKIFAALSATAVAATMAVSANAAITSDIPDSADDGSGNYQIFLLGDGATTGEFADVDATAIASADIVFTWDVVDENTWAGGAIVTQADSNGWNSLGQWSSADDGKEFSNVVSGEAVHFDLAGVFSADDTYQIITIQSYGVDVSIDYLALYDADGNVLKAVGTNPAGTTTTTTTTTSSEDDTSSTTTTTTTTTSTSSPATGATAGLALAGLALAGAAIVATKKSK